jgi:hypothetical protein
MRDDGAAESASTSVDPSAPKSLIELSEDLHAPVAAGEQACCCPSRPAVRVVLPATAQRDHPVDLLLCAHHYRLSGVQLARDGAHVFDASGALMVSGNFIAIDRIAR